MTDDRSAAWRRRHQQWLGYVQEAARAVDSGRGIPLGPSPERLVRPASTPGGEAAKVVYCAPHPDDESLSGALALRLSLEAGARVTNVAITLGSDAAQRARRRSELESACRALGFDLVIPTDPSSASASASAATAEPNGFERVNPATRETHPAEWSAKVESLRGIFDRERPDVIFTPHVEDFNTTHIGTYWLVVDALGSHLERSGRGPVTLIQTEFWHPLAEPNLMLGVGPETLAVMLVAAGEHGGEMTRNPYHLLAPARLMDNVRRGSEVVGGQGAPAQDFTFAELYRVTFVRGNELVNPRPGGLFVGPVEKVSAAMFVTRFLPRA